MANENTEPEKHIQPHKGRMKNKIILTWHAVDLEGFELISWKEKKKENISNSAYTYFYDCFSIIIDT